MSGGVGSMDDFEVILHQPGATRHLYDVNSAPMPSGVEHLANLDQLIVKQQVELLEAFTGWETRNKYNIYNKDGYQLFYAEENTDCCTMQCCGTNRPFDMDIVDWNGNEVVHLDRPFACDSCCCCCCLQSMEVSSQSRPLGTIEQKWTCCSPEFAIKDDSGNTVLTMSGPVCTWSCFGSDVEFKVKTPSGGEIGVVTKKWAGFIKEYFTDAETFVVTWPMDLDAKVKGLLLGAVILVDFMFFEKKNNEEQDGIGMWS